MNRPIKKDFFISRAGADKEIAIAITKIIRDAGCDTWLQDEDFGHASFMGRMAQGFSSGARMVALLSRSYQTSEYCKKEYEHILTSDPRNLNEGLIVLRVDDVAPIEHLKDLAYTDLVPVLSDASEMARIVRVAIGVEQSPTELDFAAIYRRAARQILHPAIEAVPGFTGRETELNALDSALRTSAVNGVPTAALTDTKSTATALQGMGGVGKSVLAKHYAWQFREHFQGIWWIHAERRQTVIDDLIALGARLIPGLAEMPDREAAAHSILDHLARANVREAHELKPWLLVYDNVHQPADIESLTPREGACILITSRWSDWYGIASEVPIDQFSPETAVKFLLKRARSDDRETASRLAKDLGYLPLALEHARTYCWRSHRSFEQYRAKLPELIKKSPLNARYAKTVFATFDLAIAQAAENCSAAEQLMNMLAFFAPDDVPLDLISEAVMGDNDRDDAVSALADGSLIRLSALEDGNPALNVHRLVQEVARARMGEKRHTVISRSLDLLLAQWPEGNDGGDPKFWPICSQLMAHALALLEQASDHDPAAEKTALLQSFVACHLASRGEHSSAEPLYRRALDIRQRVLGEDHPDTATSYNNMASNLDYQGQYEAAEPLYRRALEIRQRVLGEDHPYAAASYNNMASNLDFQGQHAAAEPLYRRALDIRQRVLGEDHPDTAGSYNDVAANLNARGQHAAAEPLYRRALDIRQRVLGEDHPSTAASYNNVASNLDFQGQYAAAEPLYRRALETRQRVLGEDHPSTAASYNNVASNLDFQGQYEAAEPLYRRALETRQRVLGEEHPDTATSYNNMASNLHYQRQHAAAEPLYRRALEIYQRVLGEEHPNTAASYNNVAANLNAQGQHAAAEPLYRRALEIYQRVLGEEHPNTAASYNNVAFNLNAQGQYEAAEPLLRRALEILKNTLPCEHPNIENVQTQLQQLHGKMGR